MEKLSSGKQIKILDHEKFDYLIRFFLKIMLQGKSLLKRNFLIILSYAGYFNFGESK